MVDERGSKTGTTKMMNKTPSIIGSNEDSVPKSSDWCKLKNH
ncbi:MULTISPECIES: hypothetical protein [unclassified Methanosarcina]|nr:MULTISPECIES: hypothetical protein [unclassified Methanosarcina]